MIYRSHIVVTVVDVPFYIPRTISFLLTDYVMSSEAQVDTTAFELAKMEYEFKTDFGIIL
jgi:hypothetical protein